MRRKKKILSLCLCFCVFILVGCVESRELTEEQESLIAEYSAGLLLRYEPDYERRLVKQEASEEAQETAMPQEITPATTAPTPQTTEEAEVETGAQTEPETLNEVSLNELYDVPGMDVSCKSYSVCDEYGDNFRARKKEDCLLVVTYRVKNTTSKPLKLNLVKRRIQYILDLDGVQYEPDISFLKNGGMNFLKTTISPKASEKAILLFEIPKNAKNPKNTVTLTVKDGDKSSVTNFK